MFGRSFWTTATQNTATQKVGFQHLEARWLLVHTHWN